MIFYGNENRILTGIIREVQDNIVKVELQSDKNGKLVNIPKNIIHSKIELKTGISQKFKLPTWFLKRNRVIPLNERLV